jgi:hypothetical protein
MSTPPRPPTPPNKSPTSSTTKTPFVKNPGEESQASTPEAPNVSKALFVSEEPNDSKYGEEHSAKLKRKIENLTKQINGYEVNDDDYDPNINHNSKDYATRVKETEKMVFKLPKKKAAKNRQNAAKNIKKRHRRRGPENKLLVVVRFLSRSAFRAFVVTTPAAPGT